MDRRQAGAADIPPPPPGAAVLVAIFWVLIGAAAGIKLARGLWPVLGLDGGAVTVAVPVGGVVGAAGAVLVGRVGNPRVLVLLMAVFAGSAAGGVVGQLPWGSYGDFVGQAVGGLIGGITWTIWLYFGRRPRATVTGQPRDKTDAANHNLAPR